MISAEHTGGVPSCCPTSPTPTDRAGSQTVGGAIERKSVSAPSLLARCHQLPESAETSRRVRQSESEKPSATRLSMEQGKNQHRRPPQELSERAWALVRWCHHRTRMKLIKPSFNIARCTFRTRAKSCTGVLEWTPPPEPGAPYVLDLTAPSNAMVLQLNSWANFQQLTQCSPFMLPLSTSLLQLSLGTVKSQVDPW